METDRLIPSVLGHRIEQRRTELNMDQGAVARRAELSRAYISRLENGLVSNPKVKDLERVATALRMTLSDLVAPDPDRYREYRFSADLDAIRREVQGLPEDLAAQVLRNFQTALEIARSARQVHEN